MCCMGDAHMQHMQLGDDDADPVGGGTVIDERATGPQIKVNCAR